MKERKMMRMMKAESAKGLSHSLAVFEQEIEQKRVILNCFERVLGAVKKGFNSTTVKVYESYVDEVVAEFVDYGYNVQTEGEDGMDETIVRISW